MSDQQASKVEQAINGVDEDRRRILSKLMRGTAFVAPVVASFAMDGLTISKAAAQTVFSNTTISDRRLKTDVTHLAKLANGHDLYRFKYLWSDVEYVGVMAQDVAKLAPDAVEEDSNGFYRVDYDAIGLSMMTYAEWCRSSGAASRASQQA